ncbi:hypothetical protein Tco_0510691 [Tanacetum coccineum]
MKFSTPEDDNCLSIDMVDEAVMDHVQEILPSSPLDSFLFELIINYQQRINTNLWEEEDDDLDDFSTITIGSQIISSDQLYSPPTRVKLRHNFPNLRNFHLIWNTPS